MLVFDALTLNVDRHAGNYGVIVDNRTGEVISFAPLFDHNLALLPYLIQTDDLEEYLAGQGPRLGDDFIKVARAVLTSDIRSDLVRIRDFAYTDPGEDMPAWRLELVNGLFRRQIEEILG